MIVQSMARQFFYDAIRFFEAQGLPPSELTKVLADYLSDRGDVSASTLDSLEEAAAYLERDEMA